MKIELEIPTERITQLMCSAIEGGDPVTTAQKGGWCMGIYFKTMDAEPPEGIWYANDSFWKSNFQIQVLVVDDENIYDRNLDVAGNIASGSLKLHTIRRRHFFQGMTVMAHKFPHQFGQVLQDNIDAPCADIFLQSVLFGDEKYA